MTQPISLDYYGLLSVVDRVPNSTETNFRLITNSYFSTPISPYVPYNSLALSGVEKNPLIFGEHSLIILTELAVKDLASLSEVSPACYSALKGNSIWKIQFQKLLPNVKPVDQSLCSFNTEQQFKIAYKWLGDELKPFVSQYETNNNILLRLRGPNGSDGELAQLWKEFEAAGGDEAVSFLCLLELPASRLTRDDHDLIEQAKKARVIKVVYETQDKLRVKLGGPDYDGTRNTLSPSSNQGQILEMIEITIPKIYNKQKIFEKVIRDSG